MCLLIDNATEIPPASKIAKNGRYALKAIVSNCFFCIIFFAVDAIADDHVRILLDTSKSMRKPTRAYDGTSYPAQDPSKLSVLSVKLFTDLLYPIFASPININNLNYNLEVFTFNKNYGALSQSGFPSHSRRNNINLVCVP